MLSKPIMKYLEQEEAGVLSSLLAQAGIDSTVKRQGLPRIFGGISNYQVQIDPKNTAKSKTILDDFKSRSAEIRAENLHRLTTFCPSCNSQNIYIVEKTNPLLKIFYLGVIIHKCKDCSAQWYT